MVMERMETESSGQVKRKNTSKVDGKIDEKKARKQFDRSGKNSLQVLFWEFNQSNEPISFHFENIGGSGQKTSYKAMAEIEGVLFEGVGTSKMMAKRLLASKALAQLRSIFISPDYPDKVSETGDTTGNETGPLQMLNQEFGQGKSIQFQVDFMGTPQNPSYKAIAVIGGTSFEGVGTSKILAKRALACTALARLRKGPSMETELTGDGRYNPFDLNKAPLPPNAFSKLPATSLQVFGAERKVKVNVEKAQQHPFMVLSETYPDLNFEWADETGRGAHKFKIETIVNGVTFFGEGRSKKLAKTNLAKSVLLCLHDITDFQEDEVSNAEKPEKAKKKFVLNQLKEATGEECTIETVKQEGADSESAFLVKVVAKGRTYEAVGRTKFGAKIKAAKKALEAQPKKPVDRSKVDITLHPNAVFQEHFKDVRFNDSENTKEDGSHEYSLETTIQGRKFRTSASSKKKAKLQLVLKVFEVLKNVAPTSWTAVDLNEINRQ